MRTEVKREWVARLRSGRYKQGRHRLLEVSGKESYHCCLGVLCEVAAENGIGHWSKLPHRPLFNTNSESEQFMLTEDVLQWSGIKQWEQRKLSNLNDVQRLGFDTIADYIEEQL